jgi:hypothetical protein
MNNHIRIFLPLTLLLSTMAYTMDKAKDKDEQRIFEVPVEVVAEVKKLEKEKALTITPEQSTILAAPAVPVVPVKKEESSSSAMSSSSSSVSSPISTSAQSKRLGFLTGL